MNRNTQRILASAGFLVATGILGAQTPKPAAAPPTPVAAPVAPPAAQTTDPGKVIVSIGDEKLTAGQFQEMIKAFPPNVQQAANGPQKRQFIEQYVQLKVAAKEAEKLGLDKKPEIKVQLGIQHDNVLAQALYQDYVATTKVTDADVAKYYEKNKTDYETAKAHHILIRFKGSPVPLVAGKKELTEEEALAKANEVKKRLEAGEDFAAVAKAESDDTNTAGGDLGEIKHKMMVPEFETAVFTQPVGKLSDPVKTQFGYHIIRVDSRTAASLESVKPDIEGKLRPDAARQAMDDLKTKSNVVIDDTYFPQIAPIVNPLPGAKK